jgi:hypothetical protein
MSDLHRAVEDEIDAFRPDRTPPFAGLLARRRARDRRRTATGAVALSVVAVAGIVFVPSILSGGEDRLPSYANPDSTQAADLAERLCADAAQEYIGEVAAAYATTVQAVRNYMIDPYGSRTGMTGGAKSGMAGTYAYPSGWAEKAPDDPAAACYIDGSFPTPAVPGAVNPERALIMTAEGVPMFMATAGSKESLPPAPLAVGDLPREPFDNPCRVLEPDTADVSVASIEGYLGRTRAEAERLASERGVTVRIAGTDGQCNDSDSDFRTDRVNVYLEDGRVSLVDAY